MSRLWSVWGGLRGCGADRLGGMAKTPRTDADYVASLERRITRLENALLPWQLGVGRFGDLVATHLQTGRRVVVAAKESNPQTEVEG